MGLFDKLFGPNIEEMKEKKDVRGLMAEMKNDNPQICVKAMEALMDLDDPETLELLLENFSKRFKFGDEMDKIEAITIMQGRVSRTSLIPVLSRSELPSDDRWKRMWKFEKVKFQRKLDLDLARPVLSKVVADSAETPVIRWYALIALAELGDRSNEVPQLLINVLSTLPEMNIYTIEESLRALSYFSINPDIISMLIKIQKGQLFKAAIDTAPRSAAIYALGASSDPSAREYLEGLATHGPHFYSERARVALKLFGKSYDEIKAKAEKEIT